MYDSMDVIFRESEPYFSSSGVPTSSSIVLNDLLDIVSSPCVNTTSETSREGETVQAKGRKMVEECELVEGYELVDPREEPPLAMPDPLDSGTYFGYYSAI
jgi:hypothetical protein